MTAKYIQEVGELKTTIIVDFEEFTDNVADLLAFLDFPQTIHIQSSNENDTLCE